MPLLIYKAVIYTNFGLWMSSTGNFYSNATKYILYKMVKSYFSSLGSCCEEVADKYEIIICMLSPISSTGSVWYEARSPLTHVSESKWSTG